MYTLHGRVPLCWQRWLLSFRDSTLYCLTVTACLLPCLKLETSGPRLIWPDTLLTPKLEYLLSTRYKRVLAFGQILRLSIHSIGLAVHGWDKVCLLLLNRIRRSMLV